MSDKIKELAAKIWAAIKSAYATFSTKTFSGKTVLIVGVAAFLVGAILF